MISLVTLLVFGMFAGKINYECYTMLARYDGIFVFAVASMIFLLFTDKKDVIEKSVRGFWGGVYHVPRRLLIWNLFDSSGNYECLV